MYNCSESNMVFSYIYFCEKDTIIFYGLSVFFTHKKFSFHDSKKRAIIQFVKFRHDEYKHIYVMTKAFVVVFFIIGWV